MTIELYQIRASKGGASCAKEHCTEGCSGHAQVAWAAFAGMEGDSILCMLQQATLTAYSLKGSLQTVPLPAHITAMHPLPHGLILSVRFTPFLHGCRGASQPCNHCHNLPCTLLASLSHLLLA